MSYDGEERREKTAIELRMEELEGRFAKHYALDEQMHKRTEELLRSLELKITKMEEILVAWNNIQGAGVVVKFIAKALAVVTAIVSPLVGLYIWFKK